MKTTKERFMGLVLPETSTGCRLWGAYSLPESSPGVGGYGVFKISTKKTVLAHRMAWELANGPIPKGMIIRHSCDTSKCVNPDHLLLGTQQDNVDDMMARGRKAHGSRCRKSELTEDVVFKIRAAAEFMSQRQLAKAFGVKSNATIHAIVNRHTWQHI